MKVQVYGPGCAKCEKVEKLVHETIARLGIEAEVEKISDYLDIAKAGIMGTPAIAIDGVIKVSGRVPRAEELEAWLKGAGE